MSYVSARGACSKYIETTIKLNGKRTTFVLDTGATETVMSVDTFTALGLSLRGLRSSKIRLREFSGQEIPVRGAIDVRVELGELSKKLPLTLVEQKGRYSLLGMNWVAQFGIYKVLKNARGDGKTGDIQIIDSSDILDEYPSLFKATSWPHVMDIPEVDIPLKAGAQPKYVKARTAPLALQEPYKQEVDRMVKADVLEPLSFSRWASPVVLVLKSNGKLRICVSSRTRPDTADMREPTESSPPPWIFGKKEERVWYQERGIELPERLQKRS